MGGLDYGSLLNALLAGLSVKGDNTGPVTPGQLVNFHIEPATLDLKVPAFVSGDLDLSFLTKSIRFLDATFPGGGVADYLATAGAILGGMPVATMEVPMQGPTLQGAIPEGITINTATPGTPVLPPRVTGAVPSVVLPTMTVPTAAAADGLSGVPGLLGKLDGSIPIPALVPVEMSVQWKVTKLDGTPVDSGSYTQLGSGAAVSFLFYGALQEANRYSPPTPQTFLVVATVTLHLGIDPPAGTYGPIMVSNQGTAAITAGSTSPLENYDIAVVFVTGGTVGTAGISYKTSTDNGMTYGPVTPLGTSTTLTVPGTGVSFSLAAGTINTNEAITVTVTGQGFYRSLDLPPVPVIVPAIPIPTLALLSNKKSFGASTIATDDDNARAIFVPDMSPIGDLSSFNATINGLVGILNNLTSIPAPPTWAPGLLGTIGTLVNLVNSYLPIGDRYPMQFVRQDAVGDTSSIKYSSSFWGTDDFDEEDESMLVIGVPGTHVKLGTDDNFGGNLLDVITGTEMFVVVDDFDNPMTFLPPPAGLPPPYQPPSVMETGGHVTDSLESIGFF